MRPSAYVRLRVHEATSARSRRRLAANWRFAQPFAPEGCGKPIKQRSRVSLDRGLLGAQRRVELERRAVETATALAVRGDGLANWPPLDAEPLDHRSWGIRTQWCHGAPGMITSLAHIAPTDGALSELLAAGGELIWRAGPLAKGAGLCHGTAGNGCAFLSLHHRLGDELWLTRARRFAMHALAQVAAARERHGVGRHSLWTGDIGTALYVSQCIDARPGLPSLDWL